MELHLKITAGLLLIVHAFHLASLQDPTSSPGRTIDESWLREVDSAPTSSSGRTIDKSWLRDVNKKKVHSKLATAASSAEDENLLSSEGSANDTSDDLNVVNTTLPSTFPNDTTQESELQDTTLSPDTTTTNTMTTTNITTETMTTMPTTTNSDRQFNMTETEEESQNSTTTPQTPTTPLISGNHTSFPDFDNDTDIKSTVPTPESNATPETTTQPEEHTGLTNSTGSTTTTTTTTEKTPEMNETSTTSSPTTVFPAEPTETDPATTTAVAPRTPEQADKTDKGAASGSSSERGLASDPQRSGRNVQWGAVLGTAVVVAIVGLAAYFIMRKKHQKAFSHQKLVEEYHADPVLRLDNSEPLDLNFGGAAYYNPGLQGDSIQMSNFPGRHSN